MTEHCELEGALSLANARVAELEEQLTGAVEGQRKYIAAELHDDVQQILVGLRMSMAPSKMAASELLSSLACDEAASLSVGHMLSASAPRRTIDRQRVDFVVRRRIRER